MAERARTKRASRGGGRAGKATGRKSPKAADGIGHNSGNSNVPDEVYLRWLPKIELAENLYNKAADQAKKRKGELASVYKAAEEDGCHRDAIKRARRIDKRDHSEVAREYAETGRVLRLMNSGLVQLDLFASIKAPPPHDPYLAGQQIGRKGGSVAECPYTAGSEDFDLWNQGWHSGQGDVLETFRN